MSAFTFLSQIEAPWRAASPGKMTPKLPKKSRKNWFTLQAESDVTTSDHRSALLTEAQAPITTSGCVR